MANLDNIVAPLRAAGLVVHETPGWITRGYAGQDLREIRGVLWHHTATKRSRFLTAAAPTLSMCIGGRPDLPGPLCNIVFDRNGEVWMVATGVANHAGAGSAPGVPKDMGNHYLIGIEMESSGIAPFDWTPAQLRNAPILGAVLERVYLQKLAPEDRLQLGHMEYSSQGKIDPAGWPGGMNGLRASINKVLAGPAPKPPAPAPKPPVKDELDMATVDDIFSKPIARQGPLATGTTNLGATVAWLDNNLRNIMNQNAAQDAVIKNLVGAVAALAAGEKFDEAKLIAGVQAAAAAGVKDAIASIETETTVNLKAQG